MALHDLWHFENAPVGLNLCVAAGGSAYNANTIYNQYTGNVGQPQFTNVATNTWSVSADGFLVNTPTPGGFAGGLVVPTVAVQDWSVATQYWIGFRTKVVSGAATGTAYLCGGTNNTSMQTVAPFFTEALMTSSGLSVVGVEHYVEIFLDRTAMIFQLYVDGILLSFGTVNTNTFSVNSYLWFGSQAAGNATLARGFRDFYFLDVDATTPGRLGPIRAKASTLAAVSGSEWTPNGAADLVTALGTAIQNPPLSTPNVQSPVDNQPLTLSLATSFADPGQKFLAVQPTLSFTGTNGNVAKVNAALVDAANNSETLGQFLSASGFVLNQKLPMQTKAPDGSNWTAAKINQSKFVLTPTT
jgi:hypothetical protein